MIGHRVICSLRCGIPVVILLVGLTPSHAYPQADAIKSRKDNFHVLSEQMKRVVQGLGDGVPINAMKDSIAAANQALLRLPSLFPPGSDRGNTRALPTIWTEPDRFKQAYDDATARMTELIAASDQTDRSKFGAAVGRMVAACGSCHADFRAK
jgi:cytochrome c556